MQELILSIDLIINISIFLSLWAWTKSVLSLHVAYRGMHFSIGPTSIFKYMKL